MERGSSGTRDDKVERPREGRDGNDLFEVEVSAGKLSTMSQKPEGTDIR